MGQAGSWFITLIGRERKKGEGESGGGGGLYLSKQTSLGLTLSGAEGKPIDSSLSVGVFDLPVTATVRCVGTYWWLF